MRGVFFGLYHTETKYVSLPNNRKFLQINAIAGNIIDVRFGKLSLHAFRDEERVICHDIHDTSSLENITQTSITSFE
jgi:hypothetical protein